MDYGSGGYYYAAPVSNPIVPMQPVQQQQQAYVQQPDQVRAANIIYWGLPHLQTCLIRWCARSPNLFSLLWEESHFPPIQSDETSPIYKLFVRASPSIRISSSQNHFLIMTQSLHRWTNSHVKCRERQSLLLVSPNLLLNRRQDRSLPSRPHTTLRFRPPPSRSTNRPASILRSTRDTVGTRPHSITN